MIVTNPISIAIGVMQLAAGCYELWWQRPYLATIWFGVSVASFSMGVIK